MDFVTFGRPSRAIPLWEQEKYSIVSSDKPNYEQYWVNDSDAVNSSYEGALWFSTRGDETLNCGDSPVFLPMIDAPLIIRIHKPASTSTGKF